MNTTRKTAIVTGASQGIGAGIVKAFVERNFNVVANLLKLTRSANSANWRGEPGVSATCSLPSKPFMLKCTSP